MRLGIQGAEKKKGGEDQFLTALTLGRMNPEPDVRGTRAAEIYIETSEPQLPASTTSRFPASWLRVQRLHRCRENYLQRKIRQKSQLRPD